MTAPLSPEERERLAAALPDAVPAPLNPAIELVKSYMRCSPQERREFLADLIASDPALLREITEGGR